jgi:cellulose biosynthesis protein BcsQ
MPKSFVFASNKGGVGKSTLSTNIAASYALTHPDKNVLFVDLTFTKSISNILLGDAAPPLQNSLIQFIEAIDKKEKNIKKLILFSIPVLAGIIHACSAFVAFCILVFDLVFIIMYYVYIGKMNKITIVSRKSTLFPNMQVIVGGDLFAKSMKDKAFPLATALKKWNLSGWESADVVFFDVDNVLDDVAKFAFILANYVIIPTSLSAMDFERLCVDPRNTPIFEFLQSIPKKNRPKVKGVIFNRLKSINNSSESDHESFTIAKAEMTIKRELEEKFREHIDVEHFVMMRELPASLMQSMLDEKKPIAKLDDATHAVENLKVICKRLID